MKQEMNISPEFPEVQDKGLVLRLKKRLTDKQEIGLCITKRDTMQNCLIKTALAGLIESRVKSMLSSSCDYKKICTDDVSSEI